MSNTSIIAALSLLATGSLTLVGCDKDRPATEVPAAATTQDAAVSDAEDDAEDDGEDEASVAPEDTPTAPDPAVAVGEPPESTEPQPDTVAEAAVPEPEAEAPTAPAPPKARAKARAKPKKKRSRARASKGEAACGEGTCA